MLIQLFHTEGCHLCTLAEDVMDEVQAITSGKYDIDVVKVDIALDDRLVQKYGVLIPVVQIESVSQFLNWPFTAVDVVRYLDQFQTTIPFTQPNTQLPTD